MKAPRRLAYLALIGNVIIWGGALPIVKPALAHITPYYFLELRYLVATIFLLPMIYAFWPATHALRTVARIIAIESLQILISLTLLYLGLANTPALTASLIGSAAPIFVTIGGILFLKEREEKREWAGLAISLMGTIILIIGPATLNATHGLSIGVVYLCGYLIANTVYLLTAKKLYRQENKLFVTAISSMLGLIGFFLIAPLMGSTPSLTSLLSIPDVVRAVVYMGILGTPIAMSLLLFGQSRIEASEASLFTYLQPLIYIPLSVFWLGDAISPIHLLALFLIATGVYIAEKRTHPSN